MMAVRRLYMRRTALPAALALILAAALCFTGCGKYLSSYSAFGLVYSNTSDSAFMRFSSFEGTKAFNMECTGESGGRVTYSAKLGSGSAVVFIDNDGTKTELFSVSAGEEAVSGTFELNRGPVYIIVETDGKCGDGDLNFGIVYDSEE